MRLIDADALWKYKFRSASERMDLSVQYMGGWNDAIDSIDENAPTVDAIPVVRCKDCSLYCICHHSDNWFCANASPINTASDFYDDNGHLLNNPQTYKASNIQTEQNTWFTVEERLPNNDDWVIVTIFDESGDTPYRYTSFGWYFDVANCWIVDNEQRRDVVAWMPLPKPYKEERKANETN